MRLEQNLRILFVLLIALVAQTIKRSYRCRLHDPMHRHIARLLSPALLGPQLLSPIHFIVVVVLDWYSPASLSAWAMFCKISLCRLTGPAT